MLAEFGLKVAHIRGGIPLLAARTPETDPQAPGAFEEIEPCTELPQELTPSCVCATPDNICFGVMIPLSWNTPPTDGKMACLRPEEPIASGDHILLLHRIVLQHVCKSVDYLCVVIPVSVP